jgi:hypothetical protein
MTARPAIIPSGSWPRRMPAELAAALASLDNSAFANIEIEQALLGAVCAIPALPRGQTRQPSLAPRVGPASVCWRETEWLLLGMGKEAP